MDPVIAKMFEAGMAERHGLAMGDFQLAQGRARDTALHGLKVVEGVIAGELLRSDDPMQLAGLNAGVRAPTTVDHPNAVVGK